METLHDFIMELAKVGFSGHFDCFDVGEEIIRFWRRGEDYYGNADADAVIDFQGLCEADCEFIMDEFVPLLGELLGTQIVG